jgi:hypothetical protein
MARSRTKEPEERIVKASTRLNHLERCPAERIEAYHETRPPRPAQAIPAQPVTVTRCIDCGAHVVDDGHRWTGDPELDDDQGGNDDGSQGQGQDEDGQQG